MAVSPTAFVDCLPAVVAMLVYLSAGLGYALRVVSGPSGSQPDGSSGPATAAGGHAQDLPENDEVDPGMTTRQVSLLRGTPRTVFGRERRRVWVYDGTALESPSWTYVAFEDGRVVSVKHVPIRELRQGPPDPSSPPPPVG
jgi:hypothetical protein